MNLYKISQTVNNHWDTYDSAIVAAESKEIARSIHPSHCKGLQEWNNYGWCAKEDVKVKLIGTAIKGTKTGVILASFNAG